jgi:hypothetical protein
MSYVSTLHTMTACTLAKCPRNDQDRSVVDRQDSVQERYSRETKMFEPHP